MYVGVFENEGYHYGGPQNKEYSILGPYWGPLIYGNYHAGIGLH